MFVMFQIMGNGFKLQILAVIVIGLTVLYLYKTRLELQELSGRSDNSQLNFDQISQRREESQVLIYNRIPKTGSTSFMNVAYELYKYNK